MGLKGVKGVKGAKGKHEALESPVVTVKIPKPATPRPSPPIYWAEDGALGAWAQEKREMKKPKKDLFEDLELNHIQAWLDGRRSKGRLVAGEIEDLNAEVNSNEKKETGEEEKIEERTSEEGEDEEMEHKDEDKADEDEDEDKADKGDDEKAEGEDGEEEDKDEEEETTAAESATSTPQAQQQQLEQQLEPLWLRRAQEAQSIYHAPAVQKTTRKTQFTGPLREDDVLEYFKDADAKRLEIFDVTRMCTYTDTVVVVEALSPKHMEGIADEFVRQVMVPKSLCC